jgi:hypothetical protein
VISCSTGEPTGESALMFGLLAATGAIEASHRTWRREQREAWEREQAAAEGQGDMPAVATNGRPLVPA